MSAESVQAKLPDMYEINLMNFNSSALDDSGQLELLPNPRRPIYMKLGSDILEMSQLATEDFTQPESEVPNPDSLYIVRNLSAEQPEAAILLDSGVSHESGIALAGLDRYRTLSRGSVVIGRGTDATPELGLSSTVSRRHLGLHFGALRGYIHLQDLDSTNGSRVYLDPADRGLISYKRKLIVLAESGPIYQTAVNRRWNR